METSLTGNVNPETLRGVAELIELRNVWGEEIFTDTLQMFLSMEYTSDEARIVISEISGANTDKIKFIRWVRGKYGFGLKEAKDHVEGLPFTIPTEDIDEIKNEAVAHGYYVNVTN